MTEMPSGRPPQPPTAPGSPAPAHGDGPTGPSAPTGRTEPREPIARRVTRYVCPHCSRGHWSRAKAVEHIARCWRNPAARACKTCPLYEPWAEGPYREHPGFPEGCGAGHDLTAGLRSGCPDWEEPAHA